MAIQQRKSTIATSQRTDYADRFDGDDDTPDWLHQGNRETEIVRNLENPFDEDIITNDFDDVRIFITSTSQGNRKWTETGLLGTLNLVRITYGDILNGESVTVPPIIFLRLSDRIGDTTFEYETPLNFKFDMSLAQNFVAVKVFKGQWIGFHFKKESDRQTFCEDLSEL